MDSQTDLVKFYVNYGPKTKHIWQLWYNSTFYIYKKKEFLPTLPILF